MPGPYPGVVAQIRSDRCVDPATGAANADVVREMLTQGMCTLTGDTSADQAWRRFFTPEDVVGLKVNCGGYPYCISAYEIVTEIVRQLTSLGVAPANIYVYERFQNQMDECNYAAHLPGGLHYVAAESANRHSDNSGYDPFTYIEADFFGEDDTRSNMPGLALPAATSRSLVQFVRRLQAQEGADRPRVSLQTTDGAAIAGIALNRGDDDVQVLTDDGKVRLLRKSDDRLRIVTSDVDWPTYHGQASGNRFSTLDRITRANVAALAPA